MPQKKNPDGAELVRANASSVISNLNNILSLLKGLPLSYSKDLQDDKRLTFNTYDNVLLGLQVMTELMNKIKFNKKTMLQAVDGSYATSTDLADWLVKKLHYPFRQAYQITGKIVVYASSKKKSLSNMSLKELQKFDNNITVPNVSKPLLPALPLICKYSCVFKSLTPAVVVLCVDVCHLHKLLIYETSLYQAGLLEAYLSQLFQ